MEAAAHAVALDPWGTVAAREGSLLQLVLTCLGHPAGRGLEEQCHLD